MRTTPLRVFTLASIAVVGTGFFKLNQGEDQIGLIMIVSGLVCTLLALLMDNARPLKTKH